MASTQPIQERKLSSLVRPQPDQSLKCPRCDSTNTKFCYYNNYSLSQPRYYCKGCRRYWTKGGSLRNVPVGGGCRKNNKRPSSKKSIGTSNSDQGFQVVDDNSTLISSFPPFLTCDPNDLSLAFDGGVLEKQSTKLYLGLDHDFGTHDHNSMLIGTDQSHSTTTFLDSYGSASFHEGSSNLHGFYGGFGEMENHEDGGDNCDEAGSTHEETAKPLMFNYDIGRDHGETNGNVFWDFPLKLGERRDDHQCWNDGLVGSSWQGHC